MIKRKWQRALVVLLALSIIGTNAQFVSAAEENTTFIEEENSDKQNTDGISNGSVQEDKEQAEEQDNTENDILEEQSEYVMETESAESDDQTEKM